MTFPNTPRRLLMIDIDGLRQDVFHQALRENKLPYLSGLLGGPEAAFGCHLDPVSTAPSITFCAQSSIFTGACPAEHGIAGNQWFDRFGRAGKGPRFYAFDIGDTLAYDDAVLTFTGPVGLVGETLSKATPTLYERAAAHHMQSTVVYHMISRGASHWIKPDLLDIARLTRGGGLFGLSAQQYDQQMMDKTIAYLQTGASPDLLTVYFMGLDHQSHHHGPQVQLDYLASFVDPQVGRLVQTLGLLDLLDNLLVVVVSDHGQIAVIPDDRHSLRLSFPFDREMGYLFDALGLDVHDYPGEDPDCDAVVASNGGLAHVYLRNRQGQWLDAPRFEQEVLPVARAFWEASLMGRYASDLYDAISMILVRDVEQDGWAAPFQALTPQGDLLPVASYLSQHPEIQTVDAAARLRQLEGPSSGDLLLLSNYADQFYFAGPTTGVHGGLHPEDSLAVASLGWLNASSDQHVRLRSVADAVIGERRQAEGRDHASLVDIVPLLSQLFNWVE